MEIKLIKRYAFWAVLLPLSYCTFWFVGANAIKNNLEPMMHFRGSNFQIAVKYDDASPRNFPFLPQLVVENPRLEFTQGPPKDEPDAIINFDGHAIVTTNLRLNRFEISLPDRLHTGEIECFHPGKWLVTTKDNLILKGMTGNFASLEYPESQMQCSMPAAGEVDGPIHEKITAMFKIQQRDLGLNDEEFQIEAKHQGARGSFVLETVMAKHRRDNTQPARFSLIKAHMNNFHEDYQLSVSTPEGRSGFILVNQFEYSGDLRIDLHNYKNALKSVFKLASPETIAKICKIMEKYANNLEGGHMQILLTGEDKQVRFGKYDYLQLLQEIYEELGG